MNLCGCYFLFYFPVLRITKPCTGFWSRMRLQRTVMSFMTGHNDGFLWRAVGACCVTDACMGNAQDLTRPAHCASRGKASLPWNM